MAWSALRCWQDVAQLARAVVQPKEPALGLLLRDFQPFPPPDAVHPLDAHLPPLVEEQAADAPVAIAAVPRRQPNDRLGQSWCCVWVEACALNAQVTTLYFGAPIVGAEGGTNDTLAGVIDPLHSPLVRNGSISIPTTLANRKVSRGFGEAPRSGIPPTAQKKTPAFPPRLHQ